MALWVAILSMLVRIFSLPRALRIISPSDAKSSSSSGKDDREFATAVDALLGLNILVYRPICWKRAAILHRYLALNGRATTINFGLRQGSDGVLDGHAWVSADGRPIFENQFPDFKVTYIFPSNVPFEIELASLTKKNFP